MKEMLNGALYIRVSTDKQEELSPDAQRRVLLDYAKANNISISKNFIFQDDGISGRTANKRPEFQRMIALAKSKEHPIDVILVWKFSRFARNQEESIVYKSMLKKDHVDVISASEPLVDGPFGSLIERIIEWMDEYYSIRLSGEVKRGMTEKALRGGYQSAAPLGYSYKSGEFPVIEPAEAEIVRKIFSEYIAGSDFSTIARHLNDAGYTTRRGNPFELRVIKYILQNPFYIGKIRWNRAKHSSYTQNSPEEIIITDGKHEPLITDEDFRLVQERIQREFRPARRKGTVYSSHWLCGLLKCCYCGSNLTINHGKSGDVFQCYKYAKGLHRNSCGISLVKAESSVLSALSDCIASGDISYNYHVIKNNSNRQLEDLKKRLNSIDMKEKRIKAAYADGIDTLEEYKENKTKLQKERSELQSQIDLLSATPANIDTDSLKEKLLNQCQSVYEILSSNADMEQKSSAIRSICEAIIYNKDNADFQIVFYVS